jgi:hypothetical protein
MLQKSIIKLSIYIVSITFGNLLSCQERNFDILPFVNGTFAGKEGYLESGPEISWKQSIWGQSIIIRPAIRFPITEANENTLQIDRYAPTWRGVLSFEYGVISNVECLKKNGYSFNLQGEFGTSGFKYFPAGNINNSIKESLTSFALEFKFIYFFASKNLNSRQFSPQFRIRYSDNATPADAAGIVNPSNISGLSTTTDLVIDKPYKVSVISPAVTVQYYSGTGFVSLSPALFYDYYSFSGINALGNSGRLRLEFGVFYYPQIKISNFKIGLIPYISIRTNGTDNFDPVIYGGQISIRFGTSFLQFF